MSRDKQIEEMEKILCEVAHYDFCKDTACRVCPVKPFAVKVYELGYRKASEVAKEIFEEIEEAMFNNHCVDDGTDYPTPHYFEELKDDIAKLKKKYTEGEG